MVAARQGSTCAQQRTQRNAHISNVRALVRRAFAGNTAAVAVASGEHCLLAAQTMADSDLCEQLQLLRAEKKTRFDSLRLALLTRVEEASVSVAAVKRVEIVHHNRAAKRACCAKADHMLEHDELLHKCLLVCGQRATPLRSTSEQALAGPVLRLLQADCAR
jgi:hypothetical protein